jgi:hypothetical protein
LLGIHHFSERARLLRRTPEVSSAALLAENSIPDRATWLGQVEGSMSSDRYPIGAEPLHNSSVREDVMVTVAELAKPDSGMTNFNAISTALDSVRSRRSEVESQMAALRFEYDKLQTAEQALAELVGTDKYALNGPAALTLLPPAGASANPTPRKREGTRVKARIVAALEAAGEEGIHRDELGQRFAEVAKTTINMTLSNLKSAGRVCSRPADAGRKSIWYFRANESENSRGSSAIAEAEFHPRRHEAQSPRIITGRHGVSLAAVSMMNGSSLQSFTD